MEKTDRNKTIGERVKKFREARGWSQNQLAKEMLNRPAIDSFYAMTVKRIEDGQREIKLGEVVELAAVLGVSIDAILSEDDSQQKEHERFLSLGKAIEQYETARTEITASVAKMYGALHELHSYFYELHDEKEHPRFKNNTVHRAFEIANEQRAWGAIEEGAQRAMSKIPDLPKSKQDPLFFSQIETTLGVMPSSWGTAQMPFEDDFDFFNNES